MDSEYKSRMDIELLKKDVSAISALCEKFDATIDKMQEIASNLSKIVSLHEQRLEIQEQSNKEFQSILEMRRIEHNNDIKDLHSRITSTNRELTEKIEETEKTILTEIQELRNEIKDDKSTTGSKIHQIDLWRYMIIGGIIVLSWLAGKFEVIRSIVN